MDFTAAYRMIVDFLGGAGGWILVALLTISAIGTVVAFASNNPEREAEEAAVLELLRR